MKTTANLSDAAVVNACRMRLGFASVFAGKEVKYIVYVCFGMETVAGPGSNFTQL